MEYNEIYYIICIAIILFAFVILIGLEIYREYQSEEKEKYQLKLLQDEVARLREINGKDKIYVE